jgi:hypothetical protein
MNNLDHISQRLKTLYLGLKYLNYLMRIRDLGSGMEKSRIQDPRWKKVGSGIRDGKVGSGINIPDPQH